MKQIITLSIVLLSALCANAQVQHKLTDNVLIIGVDKVTADVKDGMLQAHIQYSAHRLALVSGKSFQSTYYAVYDAFGRQLKSGKFAHRNAGELELIDLGTSPASCSIVFSNKPVIVNRTL